MQPVDAATLMLVRDGPSGLEVLMLRRRLDSVFVPGAYVFPGGAVDAGDHHDDVTSLCEGLAPPEPSRLTGKRESGLAFWVAAIREAFEEAGVLLAYDRNGTVVRLDDPEHRQRFLRHRRELDAGRLSLSELCRSEGLRLAADRIRYFGRWVTPPGAPRRYDTRFFIAPAPDAQTARFDNRETIGHLWISPADALSRAQRGGFSLILPTERSLVALRGFETVDALLDAVDAAQAGPRLIPDSGGSRIDLAPDPALEGVS